MRGIYWSDLWKLIREHAAPNATLALYGPNRLWPKKIDIYDRQLPRRRGIVNSFAGYHEEDHWRDSHVTTASWLNGEIPLLSKAWLDETGHALDHERTVKGAIEVMRTLIEDGCVLPTQEVKEELSRWERLSKPIQ